ncbi:phage adaptor protein [Kiloniella antarctica]|uniref:Uncharacterized protein n=1 Tax=Kiloniella antarctica TaxID=1550907 RepID=A0ABW5BNK1_9PROT
MDLSTYPGLKAAVASYLARSDLENETPVFLALAEVRLNRELRIRAMEKTSNAATVVGEGAVAKPSDFLEARTLVLETSPQRVLELLTPQQLEENRSANSGGGVPAYYAIIGGEIQLAPVPQSVTTLKLTYYGRLTPMSDTVTTNEIITNNPDLYLYGAMLEAETFLMNDERITMWGSMLDRAIQAVKGADDREAWNAGQLSTKVDIRVL